MSHKRKHDMPFGAQLLAAGGVRFRLWAPGARNVDLVLVAGPEAGAMTMPRGDGGWHELVVEGANVETRYSFRIDGTLLVPDPASRFNPDDVHGPSAVVDPEAFEWSDDGWRGLPWEQAVIYELHLGTFTGPGTFAAAIERLDDLVALGVTALEIMPVADFPGARNWGYDGVLPFAPDASYGTPDEFKSLIQAAHARGLAVLLDVVYNHFGPEGNYLHAYAPQFFTQRHHTPWGAAINFDGPGCEQVRAFFIENALYWLEEYHLDGLRVDAVHAIYDASAPHFIDALSQAVRAGPGRSRHVHIVLENDRNEARRLKRAGDGSALLASAQWNDDLHHAAHVIATGEMDGYYADYAAQPLWFLGRTLAEGFGFQGEPSPFRDGHPRGEPCDELPPVSFVNFLQTHDQVGNRAFGERFAKLADAQAHRALVACVLLAPAPPLIFMGEEFAASAPFLFFCDFHGELADAVREGRRAEFGRFEAFRDPSARARIADPNSIATFAASKLDWHECAQSPHGEMRELYRELLALRRTALVPRLAAARSGHFEVEPPGRLSVSWPLADGARWLLLANLAPDAVPARALPDGRVIFSSHAIEDTLPPWSVRVSLAE